MILAWCINPQETPIKRRNILIGRDKITSSRNELNQQAERSIDDIVLRFFDLFTNTNNQIPKLEQIKELFLPGGQLINNTNDQAVVYTVDEFIEPRKDLLTNGTLTNFQERETAHQTNIYGNIAHRKGKYEKSGEWNGEAFQGTGKKMMHFLKTKDQLFLSSVLWSDDV